MQQSQKTKDSPLWQSSSPLARTSSIRRWCLVDRGRRWEEGRRNRWWAPFGRLCSAKTTCRRCERRPRYPYSDVFWTTRGWCRRHDGVVTAGYSRPRFQGLVLPVTPLAHCTCSTREKIRLGNGNEITIRRDPHGKTG